MKTIRVAAPLLAVLTPLALVWPGLPVPVAAAGEAGGCPGGWVDEHGDCRPQVEIPVELPGTPGGSTPAPGSDEGGGTPTTADPDNSCRWVTYTDQGYWRDQHPEAPDEAVFMHQECYVDGVLQYSVSGATWFVPQQSSATPAPVPVVSPEVVAQTLWAGVEDRLRDPELTTRPPDGRPSVIHIPTFFQVGNWQGPQTASDCVAGVCITLTATPSLTIDPGDGAGPFGCEGGGTRYEGPSPDVAAARSDSCDHTYDSVTWDEPYTVTASIAWTIHWEADDGREGDLDSISMEGTAPRPVSEVTSVVVGRG